jgi:hypothetical protein
VLVPMPVLFQRPSSRRARGPRFRSPSSEERRGPLAALVSRARTAASFFRNSRIRIAANSWAVSRFSAACSCLQTHSPDDSNRPGVFLTMSQQPDGRRPTRPTRGSSSPTAAPQTHPRHTWCRPSLTSFGLCRWGTDSPAQPVTRSAR